MPIPVPASESVEAATRDEQAVEALRRGDPGAYRELVERHQKLVYAVTWSKLGDAALAEDAAQEAFIRAYRSLRLLGNGAKFAAWVTIIARNTAISLGLKHRRELAKRERWALEQPAFADPVISSEETEPPEILRQALAELSDEHRESLVLFYLEGKSGAEVASSLGISEAALRMRLMRARAALRDRLESRLGESLQRLHPTPSLVPGVMSAIGSSTAAKTGTGLGTTMLAAIGKVLPFKLAALFSTMGIFGGFFGLNFWVSKRELHRQLHNLRDQEGFRAEALRKVSNERLLKFISSFTIRFIIIFGVWKLLTHGLLYPAIGLSIGANLALFWLFSGIWTRFRFLRYISSPRVMELALLNVGLFLPPFWFWPSFCLVGLANRTRQFRINRAKYQVYGYVAWLAFTPLAVVVFAVRSNDPSWDAVYLPLSLLYSFALIYSRPPPRLDDNLFLRERLGLLKISGQNSLVGRGAERLSSAQMYAFARFLGERFLVFDSRLDGSRKELMLLANRLWRPYLFPLMLWQWRQCTRICLKPDGSVSAHCGEPGAQTLRPQMESNPQDLEKMERHVASAVADAWQSFRAGDIAAAERTIGQSPEAEIFLAPQHTLLPVWSASKRKNVLFLILMGIMFLFTFLKALFSAVFHHP